jgi:uncharacterized DUF497 family protein
LKNKLTFKRQNAFSRYMQFEWDAQKAESNFAKHGVKFAEAVQVFDDPFRVEENDSRHDYGETRTNTIGAANAMLLASVTHTDRNGITRLISARPASRKERKKYHGQNS